MPRRLRIGYPRARRQLADQASYTLTGQDATTVYTPGVSSDPRSWPLVSAASWPALCSYLGYFRLGDDFAEYGGYAMHADAANSRLYMSRIQEGGGATMGYGAMTFPSAGGYIYRALQNWLPLPSDIGYNSSGARHTGAVTYGGNFYYTRSTFYDTTGEQNSTRLWIKKVAPDLSSAGATNRMQPNRGVPVRPMAGTLTVIPPAWRSLLGGPMATLGLNSSVISSTCCGSGFGVFDPANVQDAAADVPVDVLMCHTYSNPLDAPGGHPNYAPYNSSGGTDYFNYNTVCIAGWIPDNTRSLLMAYVHGYGAAGNQPSCRPGSSTHCGPYRFQILAYDLNDLLAVKAGTKLYYEPRPYAFWNVDPAGTDNGPLSICVQQGTPSAGGYDQTNRRLMFFENYFSVNGRCHIWQIGAT